MTAYTQPAEKLLEQLGTNAQTGLSEQQARSALEKYGANRLITQKHLNFFQKFLLQLKDVMVVILIIAAAVSFVVALLEQSGEFIDSIIIIAIVILNGVLGVVQESKAEKALDALKELSSPTARVLRDGSVCVVPSAETVPGDIIHVEAGDFIPADARLLEAASLRCEESALTGESVPVEKDSAAAVAQNAAIGDRLNMLYAGCAVSYGRGVAVVTATGMATEMGKIAALLHSAAPEATPLQQKLAAMGKRLGLLAVAICALIFGIGLLQHRPPMTMFMTAVSLAVAAIPEGLTAVVTVVLALGVQRMVRKNAIIRRLPAVETLGSASIICSDKTGTLTQNRMTVRRVWAASGEIEDCTDALSAPSLLTLRLATLCSDGVVEVTDGVETAVGDPTETAIVAAALRNGLDKKTLAERYPRIGELPFDSDRKLMSTIHTCEGKTLVIVKGGYDVLLPRCTNGERAHADSVNLSMAQDALRVLAVACRELDAPPEEVTSEALECDLTFVGLIGMIDPPRAESKRAVELCHDAGITTVMITGDHVSTAGAIAQQLGILEDESQAISGGELAEMSQEELERRIRDYRVYARVSPEDKIRIVKAWQHAGEVVAMTGDGVNDAPALRAADIGCAMGITGTDVAKGAADMVLTDDNFSTIVAAVRSGRGIYDNIRKTIVFLLGSNLGEILVVFLAMILRWNVPLLAIHLLLVNIVTDALPALALGVEPTEDDVMQRKPVPRDQGLFAGGLGLAVVLQGAMIGLLTLTGYYIGCFVNLSPLVARFANSHEIGMTMAFLTLALSQLVHAMNCRSNKSVFKIGLFSNPMLTKACVLSAAIVLLICIVPPLESAFSMHPLSMLHWLVVAGLSIAPLVIVEIVKAGMRLFDKK